MLNNNNLEIRMTILRALIVSSSLVFSGCSKESADDLLSVMEDEAPGGTLGLDNACNAQKMQVVNEFGVDYRYESRTIYREESTTNDLGNGLIVVNVQSIDDGRVEYFHYFSRSYSFDARSGDCRWGRFN